MVFAVFSLENARKKYYLISYTMHLQKGMTEVMVTKISNLGSQNTKPSFIPLLPIHNIKIAVKG
jgi:hypothetical protein